MPSPQELCTDTAEINKRREIDSRDPLVQKTAELMKDVGRQVRAKKASR